MTIYINFDIETTGTVPGLHSMISFGAIAHRDPDFLCLGHFEVNMQEMEDAGWDQDTMNWWASKEQAEAYAITTGGQRWLPEVAMVQILNWLECLLKGEGDGIADGPIVFVAYPANFDMSFFNYYMQRFVSKRWRELTFNKDVGWSCMDILTMASMLLNKPYLESTKRSWPEEWSMTNPMPHTALEDARTQSHTFVQMMRTMRGLHRSMKVTGDPMVDVPGLIQMGTDYTGDESADEPDGVDLGATTSADFKEMERNE
jgi:hypothetical protein